ncbi:phasin family protein [Pelagibius sp. CAU 1746]|uniref:phasin family protein n=1 Tax=Pelagibius sp. CAU 1746 TaxID=3140370 RepID=UPI00325C263A
MPSQAKNKGAAGLPAPHPAEEDFSAQGFESLVQANAKAAEIWLESWAKLAGESAGFVTRRWKQDLDLVEKICACRTPVELLRLQSEFMQRALVDYMKEATRLGDMETEAGVSEIEVLDQGLRGAGGERKRAKRK